MSAYHFFMAQAGYSHDPKTETPMQGRIRCAKYLAYAERRAKVDGCTFTWEVDDSGSSADWIDDSKDGGRDNNPWHLWVCFARDGKGAVFASLCGIDFGRDGEPWGDPYRRVVEAELACELPIDED